MVLSIFIILALIVPGGAYLLHGGGGSRVWGLVAAGEEARGGSVYRRARATLWKRGSAPLTVRIAALSSFFLGQMIVPGVLAALLGAWVTIATTMEGRPLPVLIVVTLSGPTGVVVAARLLVAGSAMLERRDDAVLKARHAVRWVIGHNVVLLGALAVSTGLAMDEAAGAVAPAVYACISIGQALLVRRAAAAIEAYGARQREEAASLYDGDQKGFVRSALSRSW
jgi:hypothetical protein